MYYQTRYLLDTIELSLYKHTHSKDSVNRVIGIRIIKSVKYIL